jgi:Thiamine pyrophosphate enzyme, N-terminal TPP binding domain
VALEIQSRCRDRDFGPGVNNLTTGLTTANSEGDPMVALGGSVATSQSLKQIHQTLQAVSVLKPVTKFSAEASSPAVAAVKLGIPRSTLESKIRSLKINKNRFRPIPGT